MGIVNAEHVVAKIVYGVLVPIGIATIVGGLRKRIRRLALIKQERARRCER